MIEQDPRITSAARAKPRVVIVGAGFAGLSAARHLRNTPAEVLLIDRNNYHTFSPLLYQVASAGLEPEEIAQPVRGILRGASNIRFRLGQVTGVDLARRCLRLTDAEEAFDYLILATGSTTNHFGITGAAKLTVGLKDLPDAVELRNRVLQAFEQAATEKDAERRKHLMTIVVVGGGPAGVELAGALAELKAHVLRKDFPELPIADEAQVILLEAGHALLGAFPVKLGYYAGAKLRSLGVDVRLNAEVAAVETQGVRLANGELLASATMVWVAGVQGAAVADFSGTVAPRSGRIEATTTLQLPSVPNVFVIGDVARVHEAGNRGYPMLAPIAIQQGRTAAANILRLIYGKPARPFVYRNLGTMATIGRRAAVASIGPFQLTGFAAWALWLVLHLVWLVGLRNRLLVLTNWAWNYAFYEQGSRLITSKRDYV